MNCAGANIDQPAAGHQLSHQTGGPKPATPETAKAHFREAVHRQIPMYLSVIVISEFQVKQAINDLPLRNFVVLPFNVDHAMSCGILIRRLQRDSSDDRVRVKDDCKLMSVDLRTVAVSTGTLNEQALSLDRAEMVWVLGRFFDPLSGS